MVSSTLANLLVALAIAGVVTVPSIMPAEQPATTTTTGTNTHSSPANKVVGSGSTIEEFGPGEEVPILTATAKTSKPTDMIFTVSLECTILTELHTSEESPFSEARVTVVVWVEVDGVIVPINSASSPPQEPPAAGTDADKVTFCDRTYGRLVEDAEDPMDGQDNETDYIRTKSSHSFTWIRQNMGSDTHEIVVKASLREATTGEAIAEGVIGNRVLVAEPTMMANDAVV